MHSDLISDLLTRIRNAGRARQNSVKAHFSNICFAVAQILANEGYISSVQKGKDKDGFEQIEIELNNKKRDVHLKRISKPGQRIYVPTKQLPQVLNGLGIAIISTSKGIMTNKDAQAQGLGGEVLCEVW
ncbi:MAG: 30S ribosomal protein S8 [Candidatus Abawacabacteria bacterium]|nr:30S ribosomal protein S8 [Candidatus Abawacabacteria bacterium]